MSVMRGKAKDLEAKRQEDGSEDTGVKSELKSKQSSFQLSSNYMSSTLLDLIQKKPVRPEHKSIETLLGTVDRDINVYEVEIRNVGEKVSMKSEVNGVEIKVLLNLPNPSYAALMYSELRTDQKETSKVFMKNSKNNLFKETMGGMKHPSHGGNTPTLAANEVVAKARLNSLMRRLEKQPELLQTYHTIIQDQQRQEVVEVTPETPEAPQHYIPHKPVVREHVQSTKVRIVYDASAKADSESPSLNKCLGIGPPLQRKILDILVRVRFKPVFLAGDMKQAFLQIVIRETERDVLRFFWVEDLENEKPFVDRVTRILFGLGSSPFLLGRTLEEHLDKFKTEYPDYVREIREGIYVDDIKMGGKNVEETKDLKESAINIFKAGGFEVHKWHSN
eukprot:gene17215-biopygen14817